MSIEQNNSSQVDKAQDGTIPAQPLREDSSMSERPLPGNDGGSTPTSSLHLYRVRLVPLKEVRHLYVDGHYLHRARVGRQLNYAIERDGKLCGAICYALPMMRTGYLGFSSNEMLEFARLYLINNVKGLAVYSIAASLRLVRKDWIAAFPAAPQPRIVVSWHDTVRHQGTVYKAANFVFFKLTKPRKRGPMRYAKETAQFKGTRGYTQDDAHVKGTWLYPLDAATRKLIKTEVKS